jgi:hypothetical protein
MRIGFALLLVGAAAAGMSASADPPTDIPTRAKGAGRVVVASITDVQTRFDVSAHGDRLIVSDATLHVEETLKGPHVPSLQMTVEGGTVGDLTLSVSDMPTIEKGERTVLFLTQTPAGGHVPSGRGQGILKLNSANQVEDSNLTLDDVKQMVRDAR